ncbi:hypothetical protein HSBGL_0924 [Halapricum desulfuricans]|uniref:Uncharacterized protein n=1 Tax=Halapricum desulfuricans TaxID=2841257 RepID=A0A897NFZ1_9EURY|nr:hypothetical protein HSBGL_0924 [Halapricum desulfuricans]
MQTGGYLLQRKQAEVLHWRPAEFTFLLWPILPPYPYGDFVSFADFFANVEFTGLFFVLFGAASTIGIVFLVHFARVPWRDIPRVE